MKRAALAKHLAALGYGSARDVMEMMRQGRVTDAAGRGLFPDSVCDHADVRVDGKPLDPPSGVVLMLHKPVGYVSSTAGNAKPLVYDLLPPRFLRRSPVVAPVGRLDRDSSGLLLLTDDGALNHRLTSPRSHLPKVYDVTLASSLRGDEAEIFASGTLLLRGEEKPLRPAALDVIEARRARVTLQEGRYHQVRRMFAAVGNHVEALHRSAVGGLTLGDLSVGGWRVLTLAEVDALRDEVTRQRSVAAEHPSPRHST